MESKEEHLVRLLSLTTRSLTHLTASMTEMAFEMMRSEDRATKTAGQRLINHLAAIGGELDQHWEALGQYTGAPVLHEETETLIEVQLQVPQEEIEK